MSFAIVLALGPGEKEVARTADLFASVAAYEPGPARVVIIDDAAEDRGLTRLLPTPAGYELTVIPHLRRGRGEIYTTVDGPLCAAMLQAYQWLAQNPRANEQFILKLDTDALVIGPFADQLAKAFADRPAAGMIGAYTRTPNGDVRDVAHHAGIMRALHVPAHSWSRPKSMLRYWRALLGRSPDAISRHIAAARKHGYAYGEHCLGGAYALSPELLKRMRSAGYLADPALWLPTRSGEDTMMGAYVRAVGLTLDNFVADGQAFGIRYVGLPDTPQRLVDRGYSVIHSVKNDARMSEEEIRAFYCDRRGARAPTIGT